MSDDKAERGGVGGCVGCGCALGGALQPWGGETCGECIAAQIEWSLMAMNGWLVERKPSRRAAGAPSSSDSSPRTAATG